MSMADSRPFIMHNHVYKNEGIGLYLKDISTPKLMAGNNVNSTTIPLNINSFMIIYWRSYAKKRTLSSKNSFKQMMQSEMLEFNHLVSVQYFDFIFIYIYI